MLNFEKKKPPDKCTALNHDIFFITVTVHHSIEIWFASVYLQYWTCCSIKKQQATGPGDIKVRRAHVWFQSNANSRFGDLRILTRQRLLFKVKLFDIPNGFLLLLLFVRKNIKDTSHVIIRKIVQFICFVFF